VSLGINRDMYKLARTFHVIKKKKNLSNHIYFGFVPFVIIELDRKCLAARDFGTLDYISN
jgi:hypothetical protein